MAGKQFRGGFDCAAPDIKEKYGSLCQFGKPEDKPILKPHTVAEVGERDWELYFRIRKELAADKHGKWQPLKKPLPIEPIPPGEPWKLPKPKKKIYKNPNR